MASNGRVELHRHDVVVLLLGLEVLAVGDAANVVAGAIKPSVYRNPTASSKSPPGGAHRDRDRDGLRPGPSTRISIGSSAASASGRSTAVAGVDGQGADVRDVAPDRIGTAIAPVSARRPCGPTGGPGA